MANWSGYIFPFLYQDCGDGVTTWCEASMCFDSHEHELLKLNYCDQSMSAVSRESCIALKAPRKNAPEMSSAANNCLALLTN